MITLVFNLFLWMAENSCNYSGIQEGLKLLTITSAYLENAFRKWQFGSAKYFE